ncbi:hypothetical protein M0R45_026933 [Rubus argutus]|uniref:Uncharacterized protein n=1 Tax=Rubus argutus TaxID=59490 RepID=A0AAW1X0M5_RUBAR
MQIGNLRQSTMFDVSFNKLTGPIPLSFGCLTKIASTCAIFDEYVMMDLLLCCYIFPVKTVMRPMIIIGTLCVPTIPRTKIMLLQVVIVLLGVAAVVGFAVFLFRIWSYGRRRREKSSTQHACLLKLFEDDNELEVELGIRD